MRTRGRREEVGTGSAGRRAGIGDWGHHSPDPRPAALPALPLDPRWTGGKTPSPVPQTPNNRRVPTGHCTGIVAPAPAAGGEASDPRITQDRVSKIFLGAPSGQTSLTLHPSLGRPSVFRSGTRGSEVGIRPHGSVTEPSRPRPWSSKPLHALVVPFLFFFFWKISEKIQYSSLYVRTPFYKGWVSPNFFFFKVYFIPPSLSRRTCCSLSFNWKSLGTEVSSVCPLCRDPS